MLLLDEPTTGVDPASRREFAEILGGLVARGMTILMATPYLDEAERCHRTVLLDHGRILANAPARELKASLGLQMVEVFCRPVREAVRVLKAHRTVERVHAAGEKVHYVPGPGCDPDAVWRDLRAAGVEVSPWRTVTPSLEDVFIALTERTSRSQTPCRLP